jgi:hypothetical protein
LLFVDMVTSFSRCAEYLLLGSRGNATDQNY